MEDLISVSSLQERYNLNSRQAVDDRIKGLHLQKPARGKISKEQLDILDKLDEYLKTGGRIENFAQPVEAEVQQLERVPADDRELSTGQLDKSDLSTGQLDKSSDNFIELVREIAAALKPPAPPVEPLLYLKELERAAAAGWLLTTDQVKQLIGVKPVLKKGDRNFTRGSFSFVKSGKIGVSTAWKVLKKV